MMELIKLNSAKIGEDTIETVSARDLHTFLENGDAFANWIRDRINQYGFTENTDYVTFLENTKKGRPAKEYAISLDMAKELSMVERNDKGKQARQYFIECERQAKQPKPTELPTPTELAKLVIKSEEEKALLQIENQQQACKIINLSPKAEGYDQFIESEGLINLRMAMREINSKPNLGIKFLREKGYLFSEGKNQNTPKAYLVARGYFVVKTSKPNREGVVFPQTLVTPRGVAWLSNVMPNGLRETWAALKPRVEIALKEEAARRALSEADELSAHATELREYVAKRKASVKS